MQVDGSEDHFSDRDLPLSIGSAPGNHIQLPDSDQQAAYIDDAQGHLFVQPAAHLAVPLLHNDRQLLELSMNVVVTASSSGLPRSVVVKHRYCHPRPTHPQEQFPKNIPLRQRSFLSI